MFFDISLVVWCLTDHDVALSSGLREHFPSCFPIQEHDDSAKTVPVRCFSDGPAFGLFSPLPPPVSIGFTQEANISLEAGFGPILFLSAVFDGFQSGYESNLIPVHLPKGQCDVKGFILTLFFLAPSVGPFPGPYTQCGTGVPNENAHVCLMCFPGRLGLLPIRRVLTPPNS